MKKITLLLAIFILGMGITTAQIKPVTPKDIKEKTVTVSGTVKNEAGQAVKNAMVSAKGTRIEQATNANGKFSFEVPTSTTTLVIKCIGYFEKEVAAGTKINVVIKKKLSANLIDTLSPRIPGSDLLLKLHVGMHYQGGIIAYIDETGMHGLIAAPEDMKGDGLVLSTYASWYNGSIIATGATGTAIGTGKSNTDKIVAALGAVTAPEGGKYAARFCKNLVLNGYSDWYLPSKDELNELYKNKDKIGGFANIQYWSSTEGNNAQEFSTGFQHSLDVIGFMGRVRAVRSF